MSSSTRPSIFTSRNAFKPHASESQRTPTHPPRTSSPFRRQSTPDAPERGFLQAAAEAAPLVLQVPENRFARVVNGGAGNGALHQTQDKLDALVWDSLRATQRREGVSPGNHAFKGRSASVSHLITTNPPEEAPPVNVHSTASNLHKKRPSTDDRHPTSEPSHKRPRLRAPVKRYLPGYKFSTSDLNRGIEPPSPLFFSNSPDPTRPSLPPRFSSSEAAARMLSKARTEDSHVKTVSLARGVVSSSNVSTTASSRPSLDRSTTGRSASPDQNSSRDMNSVLSSIGVLELLEQDERPTFIVDLADTWNYGTATLRPIFVNQSLKSQDGLEMLLTGDGISEASSPSLYPFMQFKSWILSASVDGESLAVCLPSFVYSNITWTCSTLRKRLRIISGTAIVSPASATRPANSESLRAQTPTALATGEIPYNEATDYFGPPSTLSVSGSSSTERGTIVPSIEQSTASAAGHPTFPKDSNLLLPFGRDTYESTDLLPTPSTYVPTSPSRAHGGSCGSSVDDDNSHISVVPADSPSFDWTRLPVTDSMPSHIRFARSIDWASTSLGPIEHWSSDLRQMCNLIMASPHPAAM